jgi:hypothetical protein
MINENLSSLVIKILILLGLYFLLGYLNNRFDRKISKEKIASFVLLLLALYYVVSIILGLLFDINI